MKNKTRLNAIDLFCGAGGMSQGFAKAGFNILLGVDMNQSSIDTFKKNHRHTKTLCTDMRNLEVNNIKKLIENKQVDIIIGGPPCQGFSMAGKRIPNDPRNSLFREYLRIVNGIRPKMFVMENVKGLLSMKDTKGKYVTDIILNEFRKLNYKTECYKINTADFGVPQKRQRVFIIGIRQGYKFEFPQQSHGEKGLSNAGKRIKTWVGLKNIILDRKKVDKKYFYSDKLIKGFKRRERINKKKNVGYGWQFLNINKPSYTLSARYWKDGAEALVKYDDNCIRMLTPEECAKIQSFPETFKFAGNKREVYTQIGNAVPPKMAKIIAKSAYKTLKC